MSLPFEKRYTLYKLLNYGKPYNNYSTYKPISNNDEIETIYVDNQTCDIRLNNVGYGVSANYVDVENDIENQHYYVEIHYTTKSNKKKFETIMKYCEIDKLINKYGNKV